MARSGFELGVRRLANDLALGCDASLAVGAGLEFASARDYQVGDPLRSIHWRLSARMGRPFVALREAARRVPVYVVIDASASMRVASGALSKLDVASWAGAAIALASLQRMSPVAIVIAGDAPRLRAASLNPQDLWRSIEELRTLSHAREGACVARAIRHVRASAASTSLVVVASDLQDPGVATALRETAHHHDCAALHLRDPAEDRPVRGAFFRAVEPETGTEFLGGARDPAPATGVVARDLLRAGIDRLELRTDQPIAPALRRFLRARGLSRRDAR
jgi:uncharacterized protein (DUF58 family)